MQPERPVQTTLAFHASRIVIDVGVLLAMAAMSLPFITSDLGDRSALDADALPAVLLLLPVFLVTLIPDHTRPIHPAAAWASLAFGLAALPYAIVKLLDAGILADTLDGSLGLGAYLLIVAVIVTIVGIGIGLFRDLRGLPSGGTPRRSSAYRTRSSAMRAPGARNRTATRSAGAGTAAPSSTPDADAAAGTPDDGTESAAAETTPASPAEASRSRQPEIVVPADGAPPRLATDDPSTTAERADAAIDDHIGSMFDDEDPEEQD